jgi:hypothetical protein
MVLPQNDGDEAEVTHRPSRCGVLRGWKVIGKKRVEDSELCHLRTCFTKKDLKKKKAPTKPCNIVQIEFK